MSQLPTDPVANLQTLVRCPSVTPAEGGALAALEAMLEPMGFKTERTIFREDGTPDIENLYATHGDGDGHLMFAGHTDVVPVGDESAWSHQPFAADIDDGLLYGRGAVDMKGGIACFVAAVARILSKEQVSAGKISLLITGDEEGPAINGTFKLLQWAAERGETWDACILGEPTNPTEMGEMIKIGRRGSLSGTVSVQGIQGHVAYPHLADNPARSIVQMADALLAGPLDQGSAEFPPSNIEVTTIDIGNPAVNVIPAKASMSFNIRFNDHWTVETLEAEITRRLDEAAISRRLRSAEGAVSYRIDWKEKPSHVFLTRDETLIEIGAKAVEAITGHRPTLSTTGGTSDARYIKDYCPVIEFGLVGQTMHMVDERVAVSDLETLTSIYERMIVDWFASRA